LGRAGLGLVAGWMADWAGWMVEWMIAGTPENGYQSHNPLSTNILQTTVPNTDVDSEGYETS